MPALLQLLAVIGLSPLGGDLHPRLVATEHASLSGIVIDSLHNVPLADATVWVVGASRFSARTDPKGEFHFDSLPPGLYDIEVRHPLIESLGLIVGAKRVSLLSGVRASAAFAVPSAATIKRIACGTSASDPAGGVVVGRIRNAATRAPVDGAVVVLSWLEVQFEKGKGLQTTQRTAQSRSDAEGTFAFCSLDESLEAEISATFHEQATAAIKISLADVPLAALTLFVPTPAGASAGRREGTIALSGKVVDENDRAIGGARIQLRGFPDSARTRGDGSFTFPSPQSGTQLLVARALGYDEKQTPVDLVSAGPSPAIITLRKTPASLTTLVIHGEMSRIADKTGFTRRVLNGPGHYVTASEIALRKAPCAIDYIATVPGFIVRRDGHGGGGCAGTITVGARGIVTLRDNAIAQSFGSCVTIVVDDAEGVDISAIRPEDIVGMEFYKLATSPVRYGGGQCAAVVIWTVRYTGPHH